MREVRGKRGSTEATVQGRSKLEKRNSEWQRMDSKLQEASAESLRKNSELQRKESKLQSIQKELGEAR